MCKHQHLLKQILLTFSVPPHWIVYSTCLCSICLIMDDFISRAVENMESNRSPVAGLQEAKN